MLTAQSGNERATAINLAGKVKVILDRFITVEEEFFDPSPNRTNPDPNRFKATDFPAFSGKLKSLNKELQVIDTDIKRQRTTNVDVQKLYIGLGKYVAALCDTVSALKAISVRLAEKSRDPRQYTEREYERDLEKYQTLWRAQTEAGSQLNGLFRRIQR